MPVLASLLLSLCAQAPADDSIDRFGIHASAVHINAYGLAASYEHGALVARAEGHLAVDPLGLRGSLATLNGGYRFLRLGAREAGVSLGASGLLGVGFIQSSSGGPRLGPLATVRLELAYALNPQLSLELGGGASLWLLMVSVRDPPTVSVSDYAALLSASVGLVF